ncbi:DUF1758 domain-containing protein [Trichonephila inaurata madagascariensis]|uniref:DUF1758 domain-containing protein n=1 Tax=Trichonephila inaurata madagascariensis TaxID=2747483 RepID=A0A8X7BT02_9ARAC|nr:DUF1758 domain-containing protein [Trichonephila inaurata madagascariensis]
MTFFRLKSKGKRWCSWQNPVLELLSEKEIPQLKGLINHLRTNDCISPGEFRKGLRPVIKLDSVTTKIRPVFDASAREKGKPSLNDCLCKGVNLIELIPDILDRFRIYPIGIVADIEKAFLMLSVALKDRDYLRFFPPCNEKQLVYRHCRVVSGVSSSPYLLNASFRKL